MNGGRAVVDHGCVTLDEVFAAASVRAASLVPEMAGYLALAVGDAFSRLPFLVDERAVLLNTEGTVSLNRRGDVVQPPVAAAAFRDVLARLLAVASGGMPGLNHAARPRAESERGVDAVIGEIEAALIPVNRAAARRALGRLARETLKAKEAGKLKARPRPAPKAAAAPAVQAPAPARAPEVARPAPAGPTAEMTAFAPSAPVVAPAPRVAVAMAAAPAQLILPPAPEEDDDGGAGILEPEPTPTEIGMAPVEIDDEPFHDRRRSFEPEADPVIEIHEARPAGAPAARVAPTLVSASDSPPGPATVVEAASPTPRNTGRSTPPPAPESARPSIPEIPAKSSRRGGEPKYVVELIRRAEAARREAARLENEGAPGSQPAVVPAEPAGPRTRADDLLARFSALQDAELGMRDAARGLRHMAGLDPTPPPPALAPGSAIALPVAPPRVVVTAPEPALPLDDEAVVPTLSEALTPRSPRVQPEAPRKNRGLGLLLGITFIIGGTLVVDHFRPDLVAQAREEARALVVRARDRISPPPAGAVAGPAATVTGEAPAAPAPPRSASERPESPRAERGAGKRAR